MKNTDAPLIHPFRNYAYDKDCNFAFLYVPCDSPLHCHYDFYEFSLITHGSFVNEYEGQTFPLPKNSLIFFRKGEQHSIWIEEPQSIHFSFIVKQSYFPNMDYRQLKKYIERPLTETQCLYLTELANSLMDNSNVAMRESLSHLFLFCALSFCIMPNHERCKPKSSQGHIDNLLTRLNNLSYLNYSVNEIYKDYPIAQSSLIYQSYFFFVKLAFFYKNLFYFFSSIFYKYPETRKGRKPYYLIRFSALSPLLMPLYYPLKVQFICFYFKRLHAHFHRCPFYSFPTVMFQQVAGNDFSDRIIRCQHYLAASTTAFMKTYH